MEDALPTHAIPGRVAFAFFRRVPCSTALTTTHTAARRLYTCNIPVVMTDFRRTSELYACTPLE